jgi:tetratricopeptide (TPR) repeat protein
VTISQLVSLIPDWLAVTAGREVSVGLSREDVLRRASVLRGLLRDGKLDPVCVDLDEDLRAVFHGLVALVTDIDPKIGRHLAAEASAVYHFIRRVEWGCDDLGERRELLRRCAEVGWQALGVSIRDVCLSRNRLEDGAPLAGEGKVSPLKYRKAILHTLASLQHERNSSPAAVIRKAIRVFEGLVGDSGVAGFLDERDYVQGSAAYSASAALKMLGRLDDATRWLDRAEQSFRACVDPAPLLSAVGHARLAILFEREQFDQMLESLPTVRRGLREGGMLRFALKCDFAWALCLNNLGRHKEAREILERIRHDEKLESETGLHGLVLTRLADFLQSEGRFEEAGEQLSLALSLVESSTYSFAKADLLLVLGESLRRQGRHEEAMSAFAEGIRLYHALGMVKWLAYGRLLAAETLLALGRPRDAEIEILLALPVIEELRLVPDGFQAMALLRESVRRQKTNPEALRQLRAHLQRKR